MVQLETLWLQHNALTALPITICQLSRLRELRLNNNRLNSLPARLGDLSKLETLHLQCNRLSKIPASISALEQLVDCWMHQNDLTQLPSGIPQSLQRWKLHHNRLKELPASLGDQGKLVHLDLAGNQLKTVPPSFSNLRQLSFLRLEGNPLEQALTEICATGKFTTIEEENYGLMLRKLIDGLRSEDLENRVDTALGVTVAQAMREAVYEIQEKLQHAKEVALGADPSASRPATSSASAGRGGKQSSTRPTGPSRGRSSVQQALSKCLRRFSENEGNNGAEISRKGFRNCIQVVGSLLTGLEIDRITSRVFHVFGRCQDGGRGTLEFDGFVESLKHSTGVEMSGAGDRATARHRDVANAVVRFCSAQRAKVANSTVNTLVGGSSPTRLKRPDKRCTKGSPGVAQQNLDQIKTLADRKGVLDREAEQLRRNLDIAEEKARVVRDYDRMERDLATTNPLGGGSSPNKARRHPRRPATGLVGEGSPKSSQLHNIAAEKAELQEALRAKNREIQELRRSLKHTESVARHYNEAIAEEHRRGKAKEEARKKRLARERRSKVIDAVEKERLDAIRDKRNKIRAIFTAHANPIDGKADAKLALSKGNMIAAAGDFYRQFGKGRFGLEPRQWREKLLLTVNDAFSGGMRHPDTGRFLAFDKDDNGLLDFAEFKLFCRSLEQRLEEATGADPSKQQQGKPPGIPDDDPEGRGQEEECKAIDRSDFKVHVDFAASVNRVVPLVLRNGSETVASLKAKLAFSEALPQGDQILIHNGKRLKDAGTLFHQGVRSGDRIKLILHTS